MRLGSQHSVIKIYTSFYSFKRGQIFVVWEKDRRRKDIKTDRYFDSQLFLLLTIPRYVIFKAPFSTFCASRPGYLTGGRCRSLLPAGRSPWLQAGTDSHRLQLTQPVLDPHTALYISFHSAHDFRSTMWLLPLIYPWVSCPEKSLIDDSVNDQYVTVIRFEILWWSLDNCYWFRTSLLKSYFTYFLSQLLFRNC